jgi:hypothetical protein
MSNANPAANIPETIHTGIKYSDSTNIESKIT